MDLQENVTKTETTEQPIVLETATEWYERWLKLPLILFISVVVIFFIWGIVDLSESITELSNAGFAGWFLWQVIGVFTGAVCYIVTKIVTAPIILQVEYLKKISEKNK
ncbi:MAG: hypothetical protein IJB32_01760 [Clostridia bacterium]|nr:hypothetical protein [Clostridia bacterium]